MDREHHSHLVGRRRHHFWSDRLWVLAGDLPVFDLPDPAPDWVTVDE